MITKRETYTISVAPDAFVGELTDLLAQIPIDCQLYDILNPQMSTDKTVLIFDREEEL